jgi:hypothetical protein
MSGQNSVFQMKFGNWACSSEHSERPGLPVSPYAHPLGISHEMLLMQEKHIPEIYPFELGDSEESH